MTALLTITTICLGAWLWGLCTQLREMRDRLNDLSRANEIRNDEAEKLRNIYLRSMPKERKGKVIELVRWQ